MRFSIHKSAQTAIFKRLTLALFCACLLGLGGCEEPGLDEGENITEIVLPTDTLLNLACADVGIYVESCVLTDFENPYRNATILEFDVNNPDAETKFVLAAAIPAGPTGAKARFYLWATALARRASGENQYFTALALHELYDLNEDTLIRDQALRAYRSVLDNFFGSVVFFECCANIDPDGNPVPFSVPLNELTADAIYRTDATGFERLIPGDPLLAQSQLAQWGYTYQPATAPNFDNGVVSVNDG